MRGRVGREGPGEWYETVLYGLEGGGERCEWKDGRWDIMNSRNRGGSWWQQLVRSLEGWVKREQLLGDVITTG